MSFSPCLSFLSDSGFSGFHFGLYFCVTVPLLVLIIFKHPIDVPLTFSGGAGEGYVYIYIF